jgi:hypothetical protein
MITKEQEAALNKLECDTHCLWRPEAAIDLTLPFGFECHLHIYEADGGPHNPKGLVLNNGRPHATGASSLDISGQIARHVGANPEGKLGRGFQVRANCEAIRRKLNADR